MELEGPGLGVVEVQQGVGHRLGVGRAVDLLVILEDAPLVDVGPVLGDVDFPLAGFLVLIGQLDLVIGPGGNRAFVVVVPGGGVVHHHIDLHAAQPFEGQLAHVVIEDEHLAGGL